MFFSVRPSVFTCTAKIPWRVCMFRQRLDEADALHRSEICLSSWVTPSFCCCHLLCFILLTSFSLSPLSNLQGPPCRRRKVRHPPPLRMLPVFANEAKKKSQTCQHRVVDLNLKLSHCVFSFTEQSVRLVSQSLTPTDT